ncbi:hypothetical protein FRE64_07615 [Euhalothece natronophila Z-M001]|uniref:Uncharacterized protein n=1 Tax=Euhalothece natronophila Z-M001 TaxID=522448 RepID=A0A5B8NNQ8_9CHRO|nr:hypothetical protein [Euhalothece natronophila]QDZ39819.1 hypothetical protein FRE64_07615 [Euhalothece natronophila Z-M001]
MARLKTFGVPFLENDQNLLNFVEAEAQQQKRSKASLFRQWAYEAYLEHQKSAGNKILFNEHLN